jgi:hypothetical protein
MTLRFMGIPRRIAAPLALVLMACCGAVQAQDTPLTRDQALTLYFTDSGRSFGYQVMIARIQIETVQAEIARDAALLARSEDLYRSNSVPLIDLQIAQLKDAWNRKQLVVAEKNLEFLTAEYQAMTRLAEFFGGAPATVEDLYAIFRRGWEAGCAKGPDEVAAYAAWVAFVTKSLDRARQLNARGSLPETDVLDRVAQLAIAEANYRNRLESLDRCDKVLFPSLTDVLAVPR